MQRARRTSFGAPALRQRGVAGTPAAFRGRGPRRIPRLGNERGQAVVEFALVVPLLCLLALMLVDFAKGMNYWLDLNHVASDGARKVAVAKYDTFAEYEAYIRSRLETNELKAGGTDSIPTAPAVSICMPDGTDVGDPVTVQVDVDYHWIPFIGGPSWSIKGSATMRLEQQAKAGASGGTCT